MGSAASKPVQSSPASSTAQSNDEKSSLYSSLNHHAIDRLTKIQAESSHHASRWHKQINDDSLRRSDAPITLSAVKDWDTKAFENQASKLAQLSLHNATIKDSLRRRDVEVADQHVFSHTIPYELKTVTNQQQSGRCWLFATTNVIRLQVAKKLNLKEFELSQSYLSFWDKLEKSNSFLENMIELADVPIDDRVVSFLCKDPTSDGGQWDMVANLIEKYGIVPQSVFPESFNSSHSAQINWLCTVKLREYAIELRDIQSNLEKQLELTTSLDIDAKRATILQAQRQRKNEQMSEIYRIMAICLGSPPQPDTEFSYQYKDKDGKFCTIKATPRSFVENYTGSFDYQQRCSLVHDPRNQPNRLITINRLGNVWGGSPVLYVNTTMDVMRQAVVKSIQSGHPVFFGCDVGQFSHTPSGIMDSNLYGFDLAFNVELGLTKEQRIRMGESAMTHAMVITAVHIENGKVIRYRVENSWGDAVGQKGYMVMTDQWFQQFNYQVVVRKEDMPSHLWSLFKKGVDKDTIVLPPYDPLGALA